MEHFGILSLVPPALAIGLAVLTKNIIPSLFIGTFVGIMIYAGGNPITALEMFIRDYTFEVIASSYNAQAMAMMVIIGGFVALMTHSGGALAFTKKVTKVINSKNKAQTGSWIAGILVWFTDMGNALLVGPIFATLNDKLKVSREKFAYVLDCTTSPLVSLIPIVGWGVYNMGLIQDQLDAQGITEMTSWEAFIGAIPYNFYAIMTLILCGYLAMTGNDYGPMLKAERRAEEEGKVIRDGAVPMRKTKEVNLPEGVEPKASTMIVPVLVLLVSLFTILVSHGFPTEQVEGINIRTAIAFGFILGKLVLIGMLKYYNIMNFDKSLSTIVDGMTGMMFMIVVLVLAWNIGAVTEDLGTADFLVDLTEGFLSPTLLPAVTFLTGALMALATGTSWGVFAIMFPIALPMAFALGAPLLPTIGAVIGGGLFGDHCSPISDTTILASMGSACDHIDHFQTQMPYASTVGVIAVIMFVLAGIFETALILIPGTLAVIVLAFVLHKMALYKHPKNESSKLNY
ncbi:Na+/H+ antiporter NhaC family protein [Natranaerobius thermophilus]|uniref:Na+/H+ antiporter NhaC n=1 Tax=Natranaerobius thermophilus (strain ATCC BAA-1301 / DSM 18059 / JW/NM-WN-LF) TaxID=457570 RepID=B2A8E0_NATTJ|nr:Na+/H+ antiporter NhaC family protein [Natranaerobius thermophilus]ACB84506.1 Na+/H+ antiporter NhaC [Natranaerobius thermophilus JW/NM-WN-LF]